MKEVLPWVLQSVALRKESVDRNVTLRYSEQSAPPSLSARRAWIEISLLVVMPYLLIVALRKESVDRNIPSIMTVRLLIVALRKESVDRNGITLQLKLLCCLSLSARRAWIEISGGYGCAYLYLMSLSARRAWIEIILSLILL